MSDSLLTGNASVALHQYVDGHLITVTKPGAKIQVTIKAKKARMEKPRPTAEKKGESPDARK